MESDTKRIVTQLGDLILEQQNRICELGRNDLVLIECVRSGASPESVLAAASAVRSTLYSVDALSDKLRQLVQQLQRP